MRNIQSEKYTECDVFRVGNIKNKKCTEWEIYIAEN